MPDTIDWTSQELINTLSPANTTEDIIAWSPEELKKMIQEDYKEDIDALSSDKQKMLLEKWKNESPKNIEIFDRLIAQVKSGSIQNREVNVETEEANVQNEKVSVDTKTGEKENQTAEKLETASSTAKKALEFSKNIEKVVWDTYKWDIQASIANDIQNQKTQEYFSSLGIDLKDQEILSKPETQNILLARASVRVYTEKRDEIIGKHPEFKWNLEWSLDNLDSLRFSLGIEEKSTAKNVNKLLSDVPRDTRWQVVDTVTWLTKSNPDTVVTRTGDTIRFNDPKNEKYSYEIDLSREPPKLAKALNGLSISRNIEPLSEKKKELGKLEWDIQKLTEAVSGQKANEKINTIQSVDTSFLDEQTKDGKNPEMKKSLEQYTNSKKYLAQALTDGKPAERINAIQKMKETNSSLEDIRRKTINTENMDNPKQGELEQSLWKEQEALTYLGTLYQQLVDKSGQIQLLKEQTKNEGNNEDFEKNALYNLNFLSYIWYDALGQEGLERIIRGLNSSYNPHKDEIGTINLNEKLDTPKTQALTLAIANLVRNGRQQQSRWGIDTNQQKQEQSQKSWDTVDKSDPVIAARQTQSFGFREGLIWVRWNMSQEWWSLKTQSQFDKALLGIDPLPSANSAEQNIERSTNHIA